MWHDNPTYREDLEAIASDTSLPWHLLEGKTVLVTGATGLVGSNVVNALLFQGRHCTNACHVIALVRQEEKARQQFSAQLQDCPGRLSFVVGDITAPPDIFGKVDYIIHAASQTASAAFMAFPVETIETALRGTKNMLELARAKNVTSFVYLSSMEAYGSPRAQISLTEDAPAWFDSMSVRSCYPESKRMCEALCSAYASEYRVKAMVIRLAQTFGPGVRREDNRVFADFARKALNGEDIVMKTPGDSSRMYLYTMDAVSAILTVLLKGEQGRCYNAANKSTFCTIREMAELVADKLSDGRSKVTVQLDGESHKKYLPAHRLYLDTTKLEQLGWQPRINLAEMYLRMVKGF